jgi:hypothetical protein
LANSRRPIKSEQEERSYDPLWANALALLDYIEKTKLPVRDLTSAEIGEFVLLSGPLWIVDTAMLKAIVETPTLKKYLQAGFHRLKHL